MPKLPAARLLGITPTGVGVRMSRVRPFALNSVPAGMIDTVPGWAAIDDSIEALTAAASTTLPSWKVTSGRSVTRQV
jgi:hypothetical protein